MDETDRSLSKNLELERTKEVRSEAKFEAKSTGRLTRKLNRTLGLPRDSEYAWQLLALKTQRGPTSWRHFYRNAVTLWDNGDSQVAVTEIDGIVIAANLYWYSGAGPFPAPPQLFPKVHFKALGQVPSQEEALEIYNYNSLKGETFENIQQFNRAVESLH